MNDFGDVDKAEEASLQQRMEASLIHLVTIPNGMGMANTTLPVKFASLMRQIKYSFAADADWDQVKAICDTVVFGDNGLRDRSRSLFVHRRRVAGYIASSLVTVSLH